MKYEKCLYPDGTFYPKVSDFTNPIITERINSYNDLWFIAQLKEVCDSNNIIDVELVIPCLPDQQADRRFNENEPFNLRIVTDFINNLYFKSVTIHHPHSDVSVGLIRRCKVINNSELVNDALAQINSENLILMSSDAGGFKPLFHLADIIEWKGETTSASKSRDPHTHKLTQIIDRKDFGGADICIVDDLSVYGGTFIGLAKMLLERNVGSLYLIISHLTVQNPNKELEKYFTRIFTTNSKYETYNLNNLTIKRMF